MYGQLCIQNDINAFIGKKCNLDNKLINKYL